MKIIDRNISELIPADYNPRHISDKQFKDLVRSFKNLDILEPAVEIIGHATEDEMGVRRRGQDGRDHV